jgi:hypothetical protein
MHTNTTDAPAARAENKFASFFWFSFVRHPFSRAISAWQMALWPGFLKGDYVKFEEFALDENKLEQNSRLMAMHWKPQQWNLLTKGNCPIVNFVGVLAGGGRFEKDLEYVLGRIGSEKLWRHWKEKGFPRENAELDRTIANEAQSKIKDAIADSLYRRYQRDFELFGFNRSDPEYGQPYEAPPLPWDTARMSVAEVEVAIGGLSTTNCFAVGADTCSPSRCGDDGAGGAGPAPAYIGALSSEGRAGKEAGTKFDWQGHCAVSMKNRFTFVHVPKAGGSSMHEFIRDALCPKVGFEFRVWGVEVRVEVLGFGGLGFAVCECVCYLGCLQA